MFMRRSRAEATFQLLVHTRQYQVTTKSLLEKHTFAMSKHYISQRLPPQLQALTFELWDWDAVGGDDFVGTCALPLRDLEPMKVTTLSLPVRFGLRLGISCS